MDPPTGFFERVEALVAAVIGTAWAGREVVARRSRQRSNADSEADTDIVRAIRETSKDNQEHFSGEIEKVTTSVENLGTKLDGVAGGIEYLKGRVNGPAAGGGG